MRSAFRWIARQGTSFCTRLYFSAPSEELAFLEQTLGIFPCSHILSVVLFLLDEGAFPVTAVKTPCIFLFFPLSFSVTLLERPLADTTHVNNADLNT